MCFWMNRGQVVTLPRMGLILGESTPRADDATETKPPSCGCDLLSDGSTPDVFRPFPVNASLGGTPYHGTDSSGGFKKRYGRSQDNHNQTPVGREEVIVIVHSDAIDHILWDVQPEVLTGNSTDLVGSHDRTLMQINRENEHGEKYAGRAGYYMEMPQWIMMNIANEEG